MVITRERRFPRLSESHGLLVKCLSPICYEGLHRTHDLSLGGCGFTCRTPLGLGARLTMLISIERRVFTVSARIVRERRVGEGEFEVGVEFTSLDKREKAMLESLFELEGLHPDRKARKSITAKTAVA